MNKRPFGLKHERLVSTYLEKQDYQILTTNFRSPFGEIDIIAIHQHTLVFIEVKARSSTIYGQPYEAVNKKKLIKITKTGHNFRSQSKIKLPPATRIDVASVLTNSQGEIIDFQLMQNVTR